MNFIMGIIALVLIILVVIVMIFLHYIRLGVNFFKKAFSPDADEENFKRMSDKHYRPKQGPQFSKDYFKQSKQEKQNDSANEQQRGHRTTVTSEGITIIDSRNPDDAQRKIFSDGEGEYVDFKEE